MVSKPEMSMIHLIYDVAKFMESWAFFLLDMVKLIIYLRFFAQ
jgi:hypothetical protein